MTLSAYVGIPGLTDMGYRFYDAAGSAVAARVTTGIIDSGDGWYEVSVTVPGAAVSVRWDSTGNASAIAREYFEDRTGYSLISAYDAAKTAAQAGNAMTLTAAYDLAKTPAQVGSAMTLSAAYDAAKVAASDSAVAAVQTSVNTIDDFLDTEVAAILAAVTGGVVISAATANQIADALLKRDWTAVSGEAAASALNAMRFLRNVWGVSAGVLSVMKEDGTTPAWTRAVVSDPLADDPVTGLQ